MVVARAFLGWSVGGLMLLALGCVAGTGESETWSEQVAEVSDEVKLDCSYVKCAMPECGPRQHLSKQGCCPVCVGPEDKCAAVLCPMVMCAEGYALTVSGGDCCGRCTPVPPTADCDDDLDCPQYACFTCPCPVSECVGHHCVTTTPDASTCGTL